ncbi:MAG: hypothetical protein WBM86_15455 [Waterburya sp.]
MRGFFKIAIYGTTCPKIPHRDAQPLQGLNANGKTRVVDSNGLTHHRQDAPRWNPNHRIYCDYEYFLQCLSLWGCNCFALNPQPLVEYIQSNQGIIGQSNYDDWAKELKQILANQKSYQILADNPEYLKALNSLQDKYQKKHQVKLNIPAFKGG